MKFVIFAGGSGKRFWPISREKFPKQFQPIIDNKSTIEHQVESLIEGGYDWSDIYFSTNEKLVSLIKNIFPKIPTANIITEPTRRDLAPAVALSMAKLKKMGSGNEPVAVLWSDSYNKNPENFIKVLKTSEKKVTEDPNMFINMGNKTTFPNENVGWIEIGEKISEEDGVNYYRKTGFRYRPDLEDAKRWVDDGKHLWNTGYFVTTPDFILSKYEKFNPEIWGLLEQISAKFDTAQETKTLNELYPQMPVIHFDNVVLDNLTPEELLVVEGDFEWSDPGTLYALKQDMQESKEANVTKGHVKNLDTQDSLVYNYVKKQVVTTIGLDGFVVVNTPDALLVCHKDEIPKIKELLKDFKDDDELQKYL